MYLSRSAQGHTWLVFRRRVHVVSERKSSLAPTVLFLSPNEIRSYSSSPLCTAAGGDGASRFLFEIVSQQQRTRCVFFPPALSTASLSSHFVPLLVLLRTNCGRWPMLSNNWGSGGIRARCPWADAFLKLHFRCVRGQTAEPNTKAQCVRPRKTRMNTALPTFFGCPGGSLVAPQDMLRSRPSEDY